MDYNELNIFIKKLFNTYFNKYRLNKELKEDIIQISMMKLFIKEQEGVLSGNVENNKNYIFITVRNEIYMHFRINNRFKVDDDYDLTRFSFDLTIDNDMDNVILSNILYDVIKSNNFNIMERLLILNLLSNGTSNEFKKRENINREEYNKLYSNVKSKIKTILFPTYRYLLEMNDGKKYYFKNKKELLNKINMSADQFNAYIRLGKTKFPKYQITKIISDKK
jgi:hypothetical protein